MEGHKGKGYILLISKMFKNYGIDSYQQYDLITTFIEKNLKPGK